MLCVFCRKRVMVYPVSVYWWLVFACVLIHPWENKDHSTKNKGVDCEVSPHDIVFGYNHLQFYKMADVATLKSSCFGYIGQLNKKYREIEILLMDFSNAEAVATKSRRLSEVFELFEKKVVEYCEATTESVPDFQSAEVNHQEFQTRIQDWLWLVEAEKQKSGQKLKTESESGRHGNGDNGCSVMPPGGENVNQNRAPSVKSHSSRGSSRASGKLSTTRLKEARIKRELTKLHTKNMGLKNLSKVCHIDKFWVVISMVPKTTSLCLSRRVSVAKLVKRSSSRTKQYMSVSNYFYFFPPQKNAKKDTIQITDPKVHYWILQWQIGDICTFIN